MKTVPNLVRMPVYVFAILLSMGHLSLASARNPIWKENTQASDEIRSKIEDLVLELQFPESAAQSVSTFATELPLNSLKQRLDKARREKRQVVETERAIAAELCSLISKKIERCHPDDMTGYFDLERIVKKRRALCFGYSELYYVMANAIDLSSFVVLVIEYPDGVVNETPKSSKPMVNKHACAMTTLSDGRVTFVDLMLGSATDPVRYADYYTKVGVIDHLKPSSKVRLLPRKIRVFTLDQTRSYIHNSRGIELMVGGDFKNAKLELDKAVELDADSSSAFNNRGAACVELKRYARAVRDYSRAMELDPEDFLPVFNRGRLYIVTNRPKEAVVDNENAVKMAPHFAQAALHLGISYAGVGDKEASFRELDRAAKLDTSLVQQVQEIREKIAQIK
jgi:tetratricopeptide (TPR) repeat protein